MNDRTIAALLTGAGIVAFLALCAGASLAAARPDPVERHIFHRPAAGWPSGWASPVSPPPSR